MLTNAYGSAVNMYLQLSLNAMNIWYHILDDPGTSDATVLFGIVTYKMFGLLLLAIAVNGVAAYLLLIKEIRISSLLIAGAAVNLAFFMLPTEIHERYSIPALLFFLLVPFFKRKWMFAANGSGSGLSNSWMYGMGITIAMIHIVILLWVVYAMTLEVLNGRKERS
ncbi:hypothetical protein [Paenibacillus xylanivorans]|uniref:hypothetical protein n=1 Tax=Paenibacillus xylanivorans TaxID=1705561 RepID=UPI000B2F9424|nr:hypothetical protein [Paenibacillus xylanivorans]